VKLAVADRDGVKPGDVRCVTARGVKIALVCTSEDHLYALRASCPHQQGPLAEGSLEQMFDGDTTNDYRINTERWVLRCPWHYYEFDVKTGRAPANPDRYRVRTYPVSVEDGQIMLEV